MINIKVGHTNLYAKIIINQLMCPICAPFFKHPQS